jgi:hypothetical protein
LIFAKNQLSLHLYKIKQMQQDSGFENRFIDNCYRPFNESDYAPVFKPDDSTSLAVFPGVKVVPFSSDSIQKEPVSAASIILPVALLFVILLFVFLKNTLKSSVGSLFLIGISPKSLQENERRQIERNTLIINSINVISFFSIAFFLYAFFIRFEFLFPSFELPKSIPENFHYLTIFLAIIGFVFLFFYARSGFIALFGNIFSVSKTMKGYQKSYKLLFVSMLPVLFLVALFTTFAPFSLMNIVSFYIPVCVLAYYVIFVVISLLKFLNFTNRYTFHIFLYLCTLEILPLLVMVKWMQNVCF